MNKQIIEQFKNLKIGNQYTICKMGEFGFPYMIKMTLKDVKIAPYAQYRESVLLTFVQKGKRKATGIRFYGDFQQFMIYEGHIELMVDMFISEKSENGCVTQKSLLSFSNEYMVRAENSTEFKPIIKSA